MGFTAMTQLVVAIAKLGAFALRGYNSGVSVCMASGPKRRTKFERKRKKLENGERKEKNKKKSMPAGWTCMIKGGEDIKVYPSTGGVGRR